MKEIFDVYNEVLKKIYTDEEIVPPELKWKTISISEYNKIYEESIRDVFKFWSAEAGRLYWKKPWDKVYEGSPPRGRWFTGGVLNPYFNIVEKHKNTWIWSKPAIIWEGEEGDSKIITYSQLDELINRLATALISSGVRKGEWILIYMPPIPETIAVTLAALKIGSPFEHVFTGFGFYELARRVMNRGPPILFTVDGFYRRGKTIDTLGTVRRSVEYSGFKGHIVVVNRIGSPSLRENEILLDDFIAINKNTESVDLPSHHSLHGLHPGYRDDYKPITHPVAGYLVQVYSTSSWIGIRPRDTYFCTVWPGWITFSSYVTIGPLMIGSTIFLYDGGPDYPSWDRWWSLIEDYAVTLFLTTGTALRMLSKRSGLRVRSFNMDTLKAIVITAEPLEVDTWWWAYRVVGTGYTPVIDSDPNRLTGRIPVVNMYIQSEVGSFIAGNLINYTFPPIKPGSTGPPIPGFDIKVLVDNVLKEEGLGEIVLKSPWPAMPIEYPDEYAESWTYGLYRTRDYGYLSREKYLYVVGRIDGVYKSSGYRLSPGSINRVLSSEKGIDSTYIKCIDSDKFENLVIIYRGELNEHVARQLIRERLGSIHEPRILTKTRDNIYYCVLNKAIGLILGQCSEHEVNKLVNDICLNE